MMNDKIKNKAQQLYPIERNAECYTAFLQGVEFAMRLDAEQFCEKTYHDKGSKYKFSGRRLEREEEIKIASVDNADKRQKEINTLDYAISAKADYYNGLTYGFKDGAKWADRNPRIFKGQTKQMEEREIAFVDWWLENHKGESPTFADAIAWTERTMIKKACEWLEENYYNVYQGTWQEIKEQFINDFNKAMEE